MKGNSGNCYIMSTAFYEKFSQIIGEQVSVVCHLQGSIRWNIFITLFWCQSPSVFHSQCLKFRCILYFLAVTDISFTYQLEWGCLPLLRSKLCNLCFAKMKWFRCSNLNFLMWYWHSIYQSSCNVKMVALTSLYWKWKVCHLLNIPPPIYNAQRHNETCVVQSLKTSKYLMLFHAKIII